MSNNLSNEDIMVKEELEFQTTFYQTVAGCDNVEVVPINDIHGNMISVKQLERIESRCMKNHLRMIYKVSNGKFSTVLGVDTKKVGIMPEEGNEFTC